MNIKKITKKTLVSLLIIVQAFVSASFASLVPASAESSNDGLFFDSLIPGPDAYEWEASILAKDAGAESFAGIADMAYKNGKLYITCNEGIVVTDRDFNHLYTIKTYVYNGEEVAISKPQGIFVTEDEDIYVCEEAKGQILHFGSDGKIKRILKDPGIEEAEVPYQPSKAVVDVNNRIYVRAQGVYEGIIELDPDGKYVRYIGAVEVKVAIKDALLSLIESEESKAKKVTVNTDYSDIAIDYDGFLMATIRSNDIVGPVRRLNAAGSDIMTQYDLIVTASGYHSGKNSYSPMTIISTAPDGRFGIYDSKLGIFFIYAYDGVQLYSFGGQGKTFGSLASPVDMCFVEDRIYVADATNLSVEVYKPTEYGVLISNALKAQYDFDYAGAAYYWKQVYDINPSLISANMGLGKQALRDGDFEKAMVYFENCGDVDNYSAAYERVREAWLDENMGRLIGVILLIIVLLIAIKYIFVWLNRKESYKNSSFVKALKKIKYTCFEWPGYMLSHPFKAFDDVKYENAGSTFFCFIILILYAWMPLIKAKHTGFIANPSNTEEVNVLLVLSSTVLPLIVFIIGNWAVGTLLDGKGKLVHIFKVVAYSAYPTIYFYIAGTLLSQYIIIEESSFISFMFAFPVAMLIFYGFIGLTTVHQYSFTRSAASIFCTAVAMIVVIFIAFLLATVVSGFVNDIGTIWNEMTLYYL